MRRCLLCVSILISSLFFTSAHAQEDLRHASADERFREIEELASPVPVARVANGNPERYRQLKAEIAIQAARYRAAAAKARAFYLEFSQHQDAARARKIEATAALRGSEDRSDAEIDSAMKIAREFRQNGAFSAEDRLDIALAMERRELSRRIKLGASIGGTTERVLLAQGLRGEFGDLPALYVYYMDIARSADVATALKIANTVIQSPIAPLAAKVQAQTRCEEAALLGKTIDLKMKAAGGGIVDLAKPAGKETLLVLWSSSDPSSIEKLNLAGIVSDDMRICFLALGSTERAARPPHPDLPASAVYCYAQVGQESQAVVTALKQQYTPLPRLYAINASGDLEAYGQAAELGAIWPRRGRNMTNNADFRD